MSGFTLHSSGDIKAIRNSIRLNAERAVRRLREKDCDPLRAMFEMKFEKIGFHPTDGRELNLVEQINQTFSYLCTLEAAEFLFKQHHEIGGLVCYPGAHAPKNTLDIEALNQPNFLGAEIFSAVTPKNNGKLEKDLEKLKDRKEKHRYVFFICPTHKVTCRQPSLEKHNVHVWSIWPF